MTEQNRNYIKKEIGKLLSEIWRVKGLSEQEYGSNHPITKKLISVHEASPGICYKRNKTRPTDPAQYCPLSPNP
jgi:hypothetical protein